MLGKPSSNWPTARSTSRRGIHCTPSHACTPGELTRLEEFYTNKGIRKSMLQDELGAEYRFYQDLPSVVSVEDNFDRILIEKNHVSSKWRLTEGNEAIRST
jgi:hypothetical protein